MKQFILSTCRGTVFLLIIIVLSCGDTRVDPEQKDVNVVLITIDTLRADHLSCYGYERKTSPNIDLIAEQGIIFKNVIAPSSWTAPSMVSLFTSVYPINHGVIHGFVENNKVFMQEVFARELITLPEILQKQGYTTFGVASNHHLSEKFGFSRGFDYFHYLASLPAQHVNNILYSWEKEIRKAEKFFLWIHYCDPHNPYGPAKPWIEEYLSQPLNEEVERLAKVPMKGLLKLIPIFKQYPEALPKLIALYDSEINFVDFHIGKIFQKFDFDKNTLIIITSDHGEEFMEHDGFGHSRRLYQETIRIPLIVKMPDSSTKEVIEAQVNLIDIVPTILCILNIKSPKQILGKSLLEKKTVQKFKVAKKTAGYTFSELDRNFILKAIITPEWKYIYNYQDKTEQLYNLQSDLVELNDLASKRTEVCNHLKEELLRWTSNSKKYPAMKKDFYLSPKEQDKLKKLGYIN